MFDSINVFMSKLISILELDEKNIIGQKWNKNNNKKAFLMTAYV